MRSARSVVLWTVVSLVAGVLAFVPVRADAATPPDFEWAAQFGDTGLGHATSVALSGTDVIAGGFFSGAVDFDPGPGTAVLTSAGFNGGFVTRLDGAGTLEWAVQIGGGSDFAEVLGVATDGSGNVYATGSFFGTVDFDPDGTATFPMTSGFFGSNRDAFVVKLDSTGGFVWAKQFTGAAVDADASGNAIAVNGGVHVAGAFDGTVDFDPSPSTFDLASFGPGTMEAYVVKLELDGDFEWAVGLGTGMPADDAAAHGVDVDGSGNVVATGQFEATTYDLDPDPVDVTMLSTTGPGDFDVFVWKLSPTGDFVWARSMGGTFTDVGEGVAVDGSGDVYTTGQFFGLNADFDPTGAQTISATGGAFDSDIFVSKLDSTAGAYEWAVGLGSLLPDSGNGIDVVGSEVQVTGFFSGTTDFDPGAGVVLLPTFGFGDIFALSLDSSGAFNWAAGMGGTSSDSGLGIAAGSTVVVGSFNGTVDLDPSAGSATFTANLAGSDPFVLRLGEPSVIPSPSVTLSTPTNGASFAVGQSVVADFACTQASGGDPVASCVGSVADGASIDTSVAGSFTFSVTGTDTSGRTTVVTHAYTVGASVTCAGLTATIVGTAGNDVLTGTSGDDVIWAGDGDDEVDGRGGDDVICLEGGDDEANGGRGDDVIFGGGGDDIIKGGAGSDTLDGEGGRDKLVGKTGDDTLKGGNGDDVLRGNRGDDVLKGQKGDDKLFGHAGRDTLRGGSGRDTGKGGSGNDTCVSIERPTSC